jgi:hypothetical protein
MSANARRSSGYKPPIVGRAITATSADGFAAVADRVTLSCNGLAQHRVVGRDRGGAYLFELASLSRMNSSHRQHAFARHAIILSPQRAGVKPPASATRTGKVFLRSTFFGAKKTRDDLRVVVPETKLVGLSGLFGLAHLCKVFTVVVSQIELFAGLQAARRAIAGMVAWVSSRPDRRPLGVIGPALLTPSRAFTEHGTTRLLARLWVRA